MSKITINTTIDSDCVITVTNTTQNNVSNSFLPESAVIDYNSATDKYNFKASELRFFNFVIYNSFSGTRTVMNTGTNGVLEAPMTITGANNVSQLTKTYDLSTDGYYTILQVATMDYDTFSASKSTTRFNGGVYILSKETITGSGIYTFYIYGVSGTDAKEIVLNDLFDDSLAAIEYSIGRSNLVATCKLESCLIDKTEAFMQCEVSGQMNQKNSEYLDFIVLMMTLEAIKYRVEKCQFTIAQKYIEQLNNCGTLCSQVVSKLNSCGCGK